MSAVPPSARWGDLSLAFVAACVAGGLSSARESDAATISQVAAKATAINIRRIGLQHRGARR